LSLTPAKDDCVRLTLVRFCI